MKKLLFLLLIFSVSVRLNAQHAVYLMEKFSDASMYFSNGTYADATANYELTTGQIQYMQNGELMEIPEDNNITRIEFKDGRKFYQRIPNKFFEQVKVDNGNVLVYWKTKQVNVGNVGAYGTTTQASSVAVRISTLPGGGSLMGDPENPVYQKDVYRESCDNIYLVTLGQREHRVQTMKSLYKACGAKQEAVKKFVSDNKLTMSTAEDALKAINYAMGLFK